MVSLIININTTVTWFAVYRIYTYSDFSLNEEMFLVLQSPHFLPVTVVAVVQCAQAEDQAVESDAHQEP